MPTQLDEFVVSDFSELQNDSALHPSANANDLRRLALAISASNGLDELATDILVNLAAFPGQGGGGAQATLRQLYERPDCGDVQRDEQVRARLLHSARRVCELALVTAPAMHGGATILPLSLLVATMGGRCPVPEGGADFTAAVQAHLQRRPTRSRAARPKLEV